MNEFILDMKTFQKGAVEVERPFHDPDDKRDVALRYCKLYDQVRDLISKGLITDRLILDFKKESNNFSKYLSDYHKLGYPSIDLMQYLVDWVSVNNRRHKAGAEHAYARASRHIWPGNQVSKITIEQLIRGEGTCRTRPQRQSLRPGRIVVRREPNDLGELLKFLIPVLLIAFGIGAATVIYLTAHDGIIKPWWALAAVAIVIVVEQVIGLYRQK
jgi:hypothetical protein